MSRGPGGGAAWRIAIKYFLAVALTTLFVMLYVWQNIEVVKTGIECRELGKKERRLLDERNRLLYLIERYRRMEIVEEHARMNGLRTMRPGDFAVMAVRKTDVE